MKNAKYNLELLFNYGGLYIIRVILKKRLGSHFKMFNYDFREGCEVVDYTREAVKSYKWVRAIIGYGDGWIR